MPELPEVETIKRILEPQMQGISITEITVKRADIIAWPAKEEFCRRILGQTICGMGRRGKFLWIRLVNNSRIVLHLRMTGCLLLTPKEFPEEKHTHLIFQLHNGSQLRFSDTRRFGRFWLLQDGEADIYSGISKLGVEPFDTALSGEYLNTHLGKRKKTVKECLLDQHVIAGIGNIYADEILYQTGIHPARPANSLSTQEWERLAVSIPQCLSFFIEKNAITPEEYLKTKGRDYRNTPFLQVYGQEGKPCPKCKTCFCRTVIGGRSSTFCPVCQKRPFD